MKRFYAAESVTEGHPEGYSLEGIRIDVCLHRQSPDIAEAVAHSMEQWAGLSEEQDQRNKGAGDQGVMVGFTCRETPLLMSIESEGLKKELRAFVLHHGEKYPFQQFFVKRLNSGGLWIF